MESNSSVTALDKDLWVIDHPFRMPGGIELGTRTTLVRLTDGNLWLHSPGPLNAGIAEWISQNGPVGAIVAPNLLHHLFLGETVSAFPEATVYGPPGLEQKAGVAAEIIDSGETPWKADLETLLVGGCPKMNELVFFHASTRTLVLTDLAFNFQSASSLLTRVFLRINGALGSFGPSRLAKRVFFRDNALVKIGIERILEWDFDRVVLSHGDVLETGGHDALRESYGWLLGS